MKCSSCGTQLPERAAFCPQCGQKSGAAPTTGPAIAPGRAVEPTANDAETTVWEGGYSGKAMFGTWVVAAIVSVVLGAAAAIMPAPPLMIGAGVVAALLWLVPVINLIYRKLSIGYTLTSQRLIHRSGLLARTTGRIELIDVDDVTVHQGLIERLVGVGTIKIASSDRTDPELRLPGIDQVNAIASQIDDLRRQERRRRSVHIESV